MRQLLYCTSDEIEVFYESFASHRPRTDSPAAPRATRSSEMRGKFRRRRRTQFEINGLAILSRPRMTLHLIRAEIVVAWLVVREYEEHQMSALRAQTFPNHQPGSRIQMRRREAFDSHCDVEAAGDFAEARNETDQLSPRCLHHPRRDPTRFRPPSRYRRFAASLHRHW